MRPIVTAAEMHALDRKTIDRGLPAFTLMEIAGRAVAAAARRIVGSGSIAVVCGPGNNGGDGFVAARVLRDQGIDVGVYLAVERDLVSGDARQHLELLETTRTPQIVATAAGLADHGPAIAQCDLVIDALFGVGLRRPITGHLANVVATINRAARRLAVDLPSGLDADSGRTLGVAVDAHHTVTMAALKIALVSAPGFVRCGELEVAEIGVPQAWIASVARAGLVEPSDVARWLPVSQPLDHKGRRGHVLVVAGSRGMRGAGRLAASAALRAGAGLVTLASDGDQHQDIVGPDPVMTRVLTGGLGSLVEGKAAIVIGCGLGTADAAAAQVREVLRSGVPAVLDADALNMLAASAGAIAEAVGPIVITPHPGEAARMLAITVAEVEADRLAAARALARRIRGVVVLKGARTIVCDAGDERSAADGPIELCSINPTGGPALATAGSGDVLAGTIGGLLAQGLSGVDAARAGVFVHGLAGGELAKVFGARGVIASDLPAAIATAICSMTT